MNMDRFIPLSIASGKGWLKAEWKPSEANRRAKYYSLTPAGKKQLVTEESKWNALVETIARVMKPA
ncbi:MAG TPA: hypothetical protein VHZ55_15490 [Bryobacteraceae bacterium]|nr:hypothetical protein [Bryobacteraceae bacterium]